MNIDNFYLYLFIMALTTYLIRAVPFVLFRKKIESEFLKSFFYYIPYAVLAAMTIPAIFYSTENILSSIIGCAVAFILAIVGLPLLPVSVISCLVAFLVSYIPL